MISSNFGTATTARKSITLILGIILLTGTITSFYQSLTLSSPFIKNAQAQSLDNVLENLDCDNININGNDISIDTLPKSLGGLADLIQSEVGDNGISNGEQRAINDFIFKCINNNEYEFIPPPIEEGEEGATLSINKEWFVCNNFVIDCIIEPQEEGEQISFEDPNSGIYTQCTSNGQCGANDAAFNITINGSNPLPNTIPAQINTEQQVKIGTGPFSVIEELFSDRFVPNAIFDVENVPVQDIGFAFQRHFIEFDSAGQRVFTANFQTGSISIIDLANSNNVTNVDLLPTGGQTPNAVVFDDVGQRVFTANLQGRSISIIDLANSNNVTNVPLAGARPFSLVFDQTGDRVFTSNEGSDSVSIIDLANSNNVTNVDLLSSGGNGPRLIAFDSAGQRVFTTDVDSNSISIIDLANSNNVTNVPLPGAVFPVGIAFDQGEKRVFTANLLSNSVSIIDLVNSNNVTNVPLTPTGGNEPQAIVFDSAGQRVFTANANSDSVSIINLSNNSVTNVPLGLGGDGPVALVFDQISHRMFTANVNSHTVSIIDLANSNNVTNVDLLSSGGNGPLAITFDSAGQRVFTANSFSDSVSIIDLPTVAKICQDSGFDTGDIRTFESFGRTNQQISCVNFVGECSGTIDNGETKECTVEDYIVFLAPTDSDGIDIISSNREISIHEQIQLFTNEISNAENKIK